MVGTWYDVSAKKGRGYNEQYRSNKHESGTKFFVSNLPERCSSADLVEVLKRFGDIQGTYIARKYDRLGKRFGFVTFRNVRNLLEMGRNLKDVWIGSYKLFIVLARFVDGQKIPRERETEWKLVQGQDKGKKVSTEAIQNEIVIEQHPVNASGSGGRSFRDTLLNKEEDDDLQEIVVEPNVQAFSDWFDCGLIARVIDFGILPSLRKRIKEISEVKLWSGQIVEMERIAWIKVDGVPLSLSCMQVCDEIASKFGSVIQPAQLDEQDGDLSYACIGILSKSVDRVNQRCKLSWKNKSFVVLIEEEVGEWIPDCLVNMEDDEEEGRNSDYTINDVDSDDRNIERDEANLEGAELNASSQSSSGFNGDIQGNDCNINEVFNKHFMKRNKGVDSKLKRRKNVRRKNNIRNSPSSMGQERPKKRQREGDDLFDVDRFIFAVEGSLKVNKENGDREGSPLEFLTPDLNREAENLDLGSNGIHSGDIELVM
ncbi:putative RNA recognition motif domain, nucleotide-binding alpha-beta plait domain superfamily [Helianthus debilis subsp. tardiflorus]